MSGSSVSSPGLPEPCGGGQDQPARAAPGVLGHLRDLRHVPKLVRLAELALADRPGVRIGQRHDPVLDRLARDALPDLPGDLLAAVRQLLAAAPAAFSFAFAPRPRALRRAAAASLRASATERSSSSPVCSVSVSTSRLASPDRRRIVRVTARSLPPIDRERSRTRTLLLA